MFLHKTTLFILSVLYLQLKPAKLTHTSWAGKTPWKGEIRHILSEGPVGAHLT